MKIVHFKDGQYIELKKKHVTKNRTVETNLINAAKHLFDMSWGYAPLTPHDPVCALPYKIVGVKQYNGQQLLAMETDTPLP